MINPEEFRKVDRTGKHEQLAAVWMSEIVATRRYQIAQIYGEKVAATYSPMNSEKQFFITEGRLPHPEDFRFNEERAEYDRFKAWNDDFWEQCRKAYPESWAKHIGRKLANVARWKDLPGAKLEKEKEIEFEAYIADKLKELRQ